jgi:hypothetical protein
MRHFNARTKSIAVEGTVGVVDRSCSAATASGLKAHTSQGRHWRNA